MSKNNKSLSIAPERVAEISVVRYVNGRQIDSQSLSCYTVVNTTISKVIEEVNKRAVCIVATNDNGDI